ncbi:unnamed protein product, partial [Amoebophrya sp. A120]|eukprot:GSA120T00003139001.1
MVSCCAKPPPSPVAKPDIMSPGAETKPLELGEVVVETKKPTLVEEKVAEKPAKVEDAPAVAPTAEEPAAPEPESSAPAVDEPEHEETAKVGEENYFSSSFMTFDEKKAVFEPENVGEAEADEGNGVPCNFQIDGLTSNIAALHIAQKSFYASMAPAPPGMSILRPPAPLQTPNLTTEWSWGQQSTPTTSSKHRFHAASDALACMQLSFCSVCNGTKKTMKIGLAVVQEIQQPFQPEK